MAAKELPADAKPKRSHKATYAKDKKKGGYLVRVMGPHASDFVGREVPVTLKDNSEQPETLESVIWSGKDQDTGQPVCLYKFKAKPREIENIDF